MTKKIEKSCGYCRCGNIRFEVFGLPTLTIACHCKNCQRMSASSYSLSAVYRSDDFKLIQGEPVRGGMQETAFHYHCPQCKSWIYNRPQKIKDIINIRPMLLNNSQNYIPFIETFTSEKLPWVNVPAVHSYEKFPSIEEFQYLIKENVK